jgi:hypothetical protein
MKHKERFKLEGRPLLKTRLTRLLLYGTGFILSMSLLGWFIFIYFNLGNSEESLAAGSNYSSVNTGNWSTNSTWSGGSAPGTSLNGDNITVNTSHSVTLNSNLSVQNNSAFIINGTLTINGNLTVQNNLTLTITGSFIVNGSITTQNGASITVNGGGTLTASGNVTLGNNATINVNGTMNIGGNLTTGANPNFYGAGDVNIVGLGCTQWQGPGSCDDSSTLPIELVSFNAISTYDGVKLVWRTASELNNDHFIIERSSNGIYYALVATIEGSGTTKEFTDYEHLDNDPLFGRSYYRLSQVDFDGKSETFSPISIDVLSKTENSFVVHPNPLSGNVIYVDFRRQEAGVLELFDSRGQKVLSRAIEPTMTTIQIELNDRLQSGVYNLKYKTASSTEISKLIKQD